MNYFREDLSKDEVVSRLLHHLREAEYEVDNLENWRGVWWTKRRIEKVRKKVAKAYGRV